MTKQEYTILSKYEQNFGTAIRSNYTRNIPSKELAQLIMIYKRLTNNENISICNHCASQLLQFLKNLGKLYFEEKNKREMKQKENGKTRKSK